MLSGFVYDHVLLFAFSGFFCNVHHTFGMEVFVNNIYLIVNIIFLLSNRYGM
jgi:hypothetical protein